MKILKNFWYLFLITTLVWYLGIGFVRWEFDWIKQLADTSSVNRLWFFLGFAGKIVIDALLWKFLKEEPRKEEEQKTYIYDEDGNEKDR